MKLNYNILNVLKKKGSFEQSQKDLQNIHVLKKKGHFDRGGLKYAQCFVKRGHLKQICKIYSCFENAGFQYIQCF